MLDLIGAHGYLVHQFLSPFSDVRDDEYRGRELNRMRFHGGGGEHARALARVEKPLFLRLSVRERRLRTGRSVALAKLMKPKGIDVIDCSSGGMRGSPVVSAGPFSYGYKVPYAEQLAGTPTS